MKWDFSIVRGTSVDKALEDLKAVQQVVKTAYTIHGRGNTVNPDSYFLRFPEKQADRIIALPAYIGDEINVSGIKWIASYPGNIKNGFPRASAVLILNDYETGYPFACLESSIISATRTASSAVLAAEAIGGGGKETPSLGFVGNGLIAKYIYNHFMGNDWQIGSVHLYDKDDVESERFREHIVQKDSHDRIVVENRIEDLFAHSRIVVFATTAGSPYVSNPDLFDKSSILLNISLRDIDPKVIVSANNVADDIEHVMKANTSVHLAEGIEKNRDFMNGTLYDLLEGKSILDDAKPTVFSPFGLGVLDLAVGKYVYDKALENGSTVPIDDFFFEKSR
ncbi:MAG: 2,3-diaminopropionate biosynthesis protein SbnB [Proteobacteria bacterium]|nr:2,3-diaminopropionate biosynthesis protein SbnB [Pseudomonadota bacterium]